MERGEGRGERREERRGRGERREERRRGRGEVRESEGRKREGGREGGREQYSQLDTPHHHYQNIPQVSYPANCGSSSAMEPQPPQHWQSLREDKVKHPAPPPACRRHTFHVLHTHVPGLGGVSVIPASDTDGMTPYSIVGKLKRRKRSARMYTHQHT
jgi:hypothetical protein